MKLTTTLLAALVMLLSVTAGATEPETNETVAKVLPSKEAGFVKVLYLNPTAKKVEVKFYGESGLITKDLIRASRFENGFIKVYDMSELKTGEYRVEISDAGKTVSYPISYDKDKSIVWAKQWDSFGYNNQIISANK